jgi:iron(III) transport system ATP-binding protein
MATRIRIEGLRKEFTRGSRHAVAVQRVDLSIDPGEIFFLLGPSGCGKTTLLRMIAGFITPTAGRLFFDDAEVTDLPPNQRGVGMVFQSYALWPHMTVLENVAFGLRAQGVSVDEVHRRVKDALEVVRMSEYAERKPNELSGGQQQRVALARALVVRPKVLLLDEPLSNLDAKLRADLRSEIKRVCKASAITTVYVTHDQKEALAIADRIAVLDRGAIQQMGSPSELYYSPGSRFVATFLGELNVFAGRCESVTEQHVLVASALGRIRADALRGQSVRVGDSVVIGIRPESVSLVPMNSEQSVNRVDVQQIDRMFLGEYTVFKFQSGGESVFAHVTHHDPSGPGGQRAPEHVYIRSKDIMILTA